MVSTGPLPHPSRAAVNPTWLTKAKERQDSMVAIERQTRADARRDARIDAPRSRPCLERDHFWAAVDGASGRHRAAEQRRRKRRIKLVVGAFYLIAFSIWALPAHVWIVFAAAVAACVLLVGVMALIQARFNRLTERAAEERAAQPSGHHHDDMLCFCDLPDPCCDMGLVAHPFPCPWHTELDAPGAARAYYTEAEVADLIREANRA